MMMVFRRLGEAIEHPRYINISPRVAVIITIISDMSDKSDFHCGKKRHCRVMRRALLLTVRQQHQQRLGTLTANEQPYASLNMFSSSKSRYHCAEHS